MKIEHSLSFCSLVFCSKMRSRSRSRDHKYRSKSRSPQRSRPHKDRRREEGSKHHVKKERHDDRDHRTKVKSEPRDEDRKDFGKDVKEEEPKEPEKANFELSGALMQDTNVFNGVVIK